jgi:hypothetical protein
MSLHPQNAECPTCFRIIPLRSSDIKRDWYCRCDDLAKQVEREIKFTIELQRKVA